MSIRIIPGTGPTRTVNLRVRPAVPVSGALTPASTIQAQPGFGNALSVNTDTNPLARSAALNSVARRSDLRRDPGERQTIAGLAQITVQQLARFEIEDPDGMARQSRNLVGRILADVDTWAHTYVMLPERAHLQAVIAGSAQVLPEFAERIPEMQGLFTPLATYLERSIESFLEKMDLHQQALLHGADIQPEQLGEIQQYYTELEMLRGLYAVYQSDLQNRHVLDTGRLHQLQGLVAWRNTIENRTKNTIAERVKHLESSREASRMETAITRCLATIGPEILQAYHTADATMWGYIVAFEQGCGWKSIMAAQLKNSGALIHAGLIDPLLKGWASYVEFYKIKTEAPSDTYAPSRMDTLRRLHRDMLELRKFLTYNEFRYNKTNQYFQTYPPVKLRLQGIAELADVTQLGQMAEMAQAIVDWSQQLTEALEYYERIQIDHGKVDRALHRAEAAPKIDHKLVSTLKQKYNQSAQAVSATLARVHVTYALISYSPFISRVDDPIEKIWREVESSQQPLQTMIQRWINEGVTHDTVVQQMMAGTRNKVTAPTRAHLSEQGYVIPDLAKLLVQHNGDLRPVEPFSEDRDATPVSPLMPGHFVVRYKLDVPGKIRDAIARKLLSGEEHEASTALLGAAHSASSEISEALRTKQSITVRIQVVDGPVVELELNVIHGTESWGRSPDSGVYLTPADDQMLRNQRYVTGRLAAMRGQIIAQHTSRVSDGRQKRALRIALTEALAPLGARLLRSQVIITDEQLGFVQLAMEQAGKQVIEAVLQE